MPINALIDLFEMLKPYLERIGGEQPAIEIANPIDLISTLRLAASLIEDESTRAVADDHISLLRDALGLEAELC